MILEAWHWIAAGVILVVAEVVIPGAALVWLGATALIVGFAVLIWPAIGWEYQIIAFIILAAIAVVVALRLRGQRESTVNVGASRLVGERGTLETAIENGRGQMRLGDTVWPVKGPDLPAGTAVRVTAADGVTLIVAP
ncbi:MAG: NfeD family protein [Alphaproteobacteria bacterium]